MPYRFYHSTLLLAPWPPDLADIRDRVFVQQNLTPDTTEFAWVTTVRSPRQILGYALADTCFGERTWQLLEAAVLPSHQHQGFGRLLVADLARWMRDAGYRPKNSRWHQASTDLLDAAVFVPVN